MLKAVVDTAIFYGRCAKWAARGTFEKANAWFWLVGIPAVAIAGRYWEVGELTVPDTTPGFLTFMIVTVGVSWTIFFAIRFFGAPVAFHRELAAENDGFRHRLTPRFILSFDDSSCVHLVPREGTTRRRTGKFEHCRAWWVLIRATNESDAMIHACVAHLAAIHFRAPDQEFVRLPYHMNASLNMGTFEPVNIPAKLNAHINIFAVDEIDQRIRIQWPSELQVYEHLFDPIGIYKLTIQVSTSDAGHKTFDVELDWRGGFEKPRVSVEAPR